MSTDPYGQYWSPYVGMGNDPINLSDPDGGSTIWGAKISRFFYKLVGKDPGPIYQATGGDRYSFGFNTTSADGTINGHFGGNYNAPKSPDWLDNKYVSGFANIVAGHEMQNMQGALETYQRDGFKAYIHQSIGNAHAENSFAFAAGGYAGYRGSGGVAKTGVNAVEQVAVYGNSLKSLKPTWGYKLYSTDGTFLKNGITSKLVPESRYTKSFMSNKFMEKFPFPNRKAAWDWEFQQNQILRGPLNKNMH